MQRRELVGKIGIDSCVLEADEARERQTEFYRKYAAVTKRTLSRPLFQGFLRWMLAKESIEGDMISKIKVMVFPFRNEKGNWLAGRINRKGDIYIFPKKKESCKKLLRKFEKDTVYFYIKARAMAALIHELLHLRYANDENIVRQKTEKYFQIFLRKRNTRDSKTHSILKVLFTARGATC